MWLIQSHNTPCQYFTPLGNHFRAVAGETENVIFAMFGKAVVFDPFTNQMLFAQTATLPAYAQRNRFVMLIA